MDYNEAGLIAWFKRLFASITGRRKISAEKQVLTNIRNMHDIAEDKKVKPSWIDEYIEHMYDMIEKDSTETEGWTNQALLTAAQKLRIATYLKER